MRMTKLAYYARSQAIYGTPQEDRDKAAIEQLGFTVIEFMSEEIQAEADRTGMEIFKLLVAKADVLFFRAHLDGLIGAGVACEIKTAEEHDLPVFELPHLYQRRFLTVPETKDYLAYAGQR